MATAVPNPLTMATVDQSTPTNPPGNNTGQWGDGYSWIVQILPYMEEKPLYDRMSAAQRTGTRRLASCRTRLEDGASLG